MLNLTMKGSWLSGIEVGYLRLVLEISRLEGRVGAGQFPSYSMRVASLTLIVSSSIPARILSPLNDLLYARPILRNILSNALVKCSGSSGPRGGVRSGPHHSLSLKERRLLLHQ